MRNSFISETDVEEAINYLSRNAEIAAQARANRIYMEEYRKVIKAKLMQEQAMQPVNAQERNAYADTRYNTHLEAMKTAIFEDEKHRFLLSAAEAKLDAWRTQQATERAMKL